MVGQRKKKRQPGEIVQEELSPRICTNFRQEELFTRILTNFQLEEEYFKFKGSWYILVYKYTYIWVNFITTSLRPNPGNHGLC